MSLAVYLSAGLGNRLFQYASVKGLAKKYNLNFWIYAIDHNFEHNYDNYDWNLILMLKDNQSSQTCKQITRFVMQNTQVIPIWHQPPNQHLGYHEPKIDEIQDHVLYGYFQSEQYFSHIKDELIDKFKEPPNISPILDQYLGSINHNNLCIIHLRLKDKIGDARHFVNYQLYYQRCIDHVRSKQEIGNSPPLFLIMCETPHEVDQIYPQLLPYIGQNYLWIPRNLGSNLEMFDFYLIGRIKTLIGSCSTFMWWGAYINPIPDKQIYLPDRFTNDLSNNGVPMAGAIIVPVD